jgi:DnaJ-class molecular chaperone
MIRKLFVLGAFCAALISMAGCKMFEAGVEGYHAHGSYGTPRVCSACGGSGQAVNGGPMSCARCRGERTTRY